MDWQRLLIVAHTLRADYQSLPQAQLCLYSSLIFRNSVATEPQSLLCSVATFEVITWQVAAWSSSTLSAGMRQYNACTYLLL